MKSIRFIFFVLLFANILCAQEYIFFDDSPNETYYDPSWGFVNPPSNLNLKGPENDKFPVDPNIKYSGMNSLILNWNSQSGGDWGIAVSKDWTPYDVTKVDSIIFMIYSQENLSKVDFPVMFIEDINNKRTDKQDVSNYINDLQPNVWTRFSVPLDIFENTVEVDYTQIKTIFWGQNNSDGVEHKVWLDDVKMIAAYQTDTIPPTIPTNISILGYEKHIELFWNPNSEDDIAGYKIYRKEGDNFNLLTTTARDENFYLNFFDSANVSHSYKVSAIDMSGNESELSSEFTASTHSMTDEEFLTMVQKSTFRYFWDYAHPVSGLSRERLGSDNTVTSGGSGFGIMALLVGVERGFITRSEAVQQMLTILNFLATKADTFHGAFSHWLNGETGKVIPFSQYDNGGDLVETAYMIQGLLTAKQYFDGDDESETQIRNLITYIWERVEWSWYRHFTSSNYLYWHWSPNYNWQMNMTIQGPNETMITYLLAIASPTYSVPASLYHNGWASSSNYVNGETFYGYKLWVGWDYGGPLFFAHYSFLGFDPRNKKDQYANYFMNNKNHTLINRAYCIENHKNFPGYDSVTWGLTASDDPFGYSVHEPDFGNNRDNGTITPTAALSSMPYTPDESIAVLKNLYRTYGNKVYGFYGFKDAFNVKKNWYADSYLAIDQGPIIVMIENYRTELLWKNFMKNPEIQPMLDSIGFVADSITSVDDDLINPKEFSLSQNYPNPFNPTTKIKYTITASPKSSPKERTFVQLIVYDLLGKEIAILVNEEKSPGEYEVKFDGKGLSSGMYFYELRAGNFVQVKKMILLK